MNALRALPALATALLAAACASSGGPAYGRSATFQAENAFEVKVPAGTRQVRAWFAIPQGDAAQEVKDLQVSCPHPFEVVADSEGNWILFVEAKGEAVEPFKVVETFTVTRREIRGGPDATRTRPLNADETREMARYLQPNTHVKIDDAIRKVADEAVGKEQNPVLAARRIYDWVLKNVEYWVKDPANKKASPVGSAEYCLASKTGNCTDFHSLWTAMARAKGIPTRIVYGSFFKKELDGKDADQSYHCWVEFWAPNIGWIPHDCAVADIFVGDFTLDDQNRARVQLTTAAGYEKGDPAMVDYYFGNLEERRVTFNRGRDLTIPPGQATGTVNALPKAFIEADGKALPEGAGWTRKLTFREVR
jgi:transglutaminase-like putative cysteine protease